jgi:nicotinate phosphoribosyltransferase
MLYFIWTYYPDMEVTFKFKNRSKVALAPLIDPTELREQLQAVAQMSFSNESINIFRGWGMFSSEFLVAIQNLKLTVPNVWIDDEGELQIEASGTWFETTLWEIYVLPIVSELYGRAMMRTLNVSRTDIEKEALIRVKQKIALFSQYPEFRLMQFGLRRRMAGWLEDMITEELLLHLPQGVLMGASNIYVANKFNIEAQGTNAHELYMVLAAYARHASDAAVRDSPYEVLRKWQSLFGHKALIILDDAFGSEAFRDQLPLGLLQAYRGFRHDSGDPYWYGNATVDLYNKYSINPKHKTLFFSDGLTPEAAIDLYLTFRDLINTGFGMGTNLTFDIGFFKALSLIMKVSMAAGKPAVKLPNNLEKSMGLLTEIKVYERIFRHTRAERTPVIY